VFKKIVYGFAIGWTVIIAVLCLIKLTNLPTFGVSGIDKYVHFTFHFVFTVLWGYYSWLKNNSTALKLILKTVLVSLLYGILIEFLQETCTKTRHADILDVLANLTGATTAFLFFVVYKSKQK
jgi:VanZ family protein